MSKHFKMTNLRPLTYFRSLEAVRRGDFVWGAGERGADERAPVVVDHPAGVVEGGLDGRLLVLRVEEGADVDVGRHRRLPLPVGQVRHAGRQEAQQQAQEPPPRGLVRREEHFVKFEAVGFLILGEILLSVAPRPPPL